MDPAEPEPDRRQRIADYPRGLRDRCALSWLGAAPALFAHPDGRTPAPLLLWLHGRSVSKELDSARYLRLIRAGIAVCAIDLPGHGERANAALQAPRGLPRLLRATLDELDRVVEALLAHPEWGPLVVAERLALGGMSAGGIVTLRRLGAPHGFRCAAVESTVGDLSAAADSRWDQELAAELSDLDPARQVSGWRPIPLLALHSERDAVAPLAGVQRFVEALAAHYRALGADPALVRLVTFAETGAPLEHAGFGREAARARALLVEHLARHLVGRPL